MSTSDANLESLKRQYEAALVNAAHSEWTIESSSLGTRMLHHDLLTREENLRQDYVEQARQLAVKIHEVDPRDGMQVTTDIERDVDQYMERRKADYGK